jgi:hypothetical protein
MKCLLGYKTSILRDSRGIRICPVNHSLDNRPAGSQDGSPAGPREGKEGKEKSVLSDIDLMAPNHGQGSPPLADSFSRHVTCWSMEDHLRDLAFFVLNKRRRCVESLDGEFELRFGNERHFPHVRHLQEETAVFP